MGHLPLSKLLIECGMDKFEVRRLNLRALLRTECDGRMATLADRIGRAASYVSRMLLPEGRPGKKRIGEDMRDIIEDAFSLQRGRLDDEESAARERGAQLDEPSSVASRPSETKSAPSQPRADSPLASVTSSTETTLERLDAEEKRILELFRRATKEGKMMIYGAATVAPKESETGLSFPRHQ